MKKIFLKPKKEHFVKRMHPWIFSGAIRNHDEGLEDGDPVEVYSSRGEFIANGHFQEGSIAIRVLGYAQRDFDAGFWNGMLQNAADYRKVLGLPSDRTNCYRLVHGAGDGLPGLVVDVYGDTAVLQCHSIGMHRAKDQICEAVLLAAPGIKAVYDKSKDSLPQRYGESFENGYLVGESAPQIVLENGLSFFVDWEKGQKTGFFLDQRDNRQLLAKYVKGKSVLNTFCYSGGFSVYALNAGASSVHSVDLSEKAVKWTERNVVENPNATNHQSSTSDVLKFLKETDLYEVVVVDPPAFAKKPSKRHKAVQGYKRLNAMAMQKVEKGGIMFTFSCSQVVDRQLFYDTIVAAAIEVGRKVKVMHHLSQPADHPVNLFHPEGSYLKGLVLRIED